MTRHILIRAGAVTATAELNETATARAIAAALPVRAEAQTWGDEIYFAIPVDQPLEANAKELVQPGDLGYWPTGRAFCIFFGPTPISRGNEIRPASAVNLIGRVLVDAGVFKQVADGEPVQIDAIPAGKSRRV